MRRASCEHKKRLFDADFCKRRAAPRAVTDTPTLIADGDFGLHRDRTLLTAQLAVRDVGYPYLCLQMEIIHSHDLRRERDVTDNVLYGVPAAGALLAVAPARGTVMSPYARLHTMSVGSSPSSAGAAPSSRGTNNLLQ